MIDEPRVDELKLSKVLRALSEPTRLAVVAQVAAREILCGALRVDVAPSTLSQHLRVLREAGVTHTSVIGRQRWLSLRRADMDARFPGLLDSVLPIYLDVLPTRLSLAPPLASSPQEARIAN